MERLKDARRSWEIDVSAGRTEINNAHIDHSHAQTEREREREWLAPCRERRVFQIESDDNRNTSESDKSGHITYVWARIKSHNMDRSICDYEDVRRDRCPLFRLQWPWPLTFWSLRELFLNFDHSIMTCNLRDDMDDSKVIVSTNETRKPSERMPKIAAIRRENKLQTS